MIYVLMKKYEVNMLEREYMSMLFRLQRKMVSTM